MKELIKHKTEFVVAAIFVFFYYGMGFMTSYQPDVYYSINDPEKLIQAYNSEGRFVLSILYRLLRWPRSTYNLFYAVSFTLSMCVFCASIVFFSKIIKHIVKDRYDVNCNAQTVFITIVSCITIGNIFSAEFFLYPYSTVGFALDIFFCLAAASRFMSLTSTGYSIRGVFSTIILLVLATMIYEPVLALFVIVSTLFAVISSKSIKSIIFSQVCCASFYGLSMGSKYLVTRFVLGASRSSIGRSSFSDTIQKYTPKGKVPEVFIFDRITFGMWTFGIISAILFTLLVCHLFAKRNWIECLKILYILMVVVIMGLLPYIMGVSGNFKPRIYYPIGTICGIMIIYGVSTGVLKLNTHNYSLICVCVLVGVMSGSQWFSFVQMFTDQYITNYDDRFISEMIGECIDEYEEKSDQKIQFVSFYCDKTRTKYIRNDGWCITQRAYDATWSKLPVLNFYLKRNYDQGETDDNIAHYFFDHDWNTFSAEQVICAGDTAHVCTF